MINEQYAGVKDIFESVAPEQVGLTSASILNLLDEFSRRNIQMHSLMILRHGKQAAAMWWKPYAPEIPHHLYSCSKSFTSTAVGLAISEGKLSLDDRIARFFPRRISTAADDRIYAVTIKHLLTMTSGAVTQNEAAMNIHTDWVEWFLNTPLRYYPGERFIYNSLNTYMLSAIVSKVAGCGLTDYLTPRLFEPLGIERPRWDKCPMGIECGGWGLSLKTEDLAKFSQLYLSNGVWQGKRLLSEEWVLDAGKKHTESNTDGKMPSGPDTTAGYGYQFWIDRDQSSYRADGMMGQYGIIIPEKDMVIATTAGCTDQIKVLEAIWETFIPLVDSIPEGSDAGTDYDELCEIIGELTLPKPLPCIRSRALEDRITGKAFGFPVNMFSLLPLPLRYLMKISPLGIDRLRFDFGDDISYVSWVEDGSAKRVPFRLDGEYTYCELHYGARALKIAAIASWIEADTLELDVRAITTPHMQKAVFRFDGDSVFYTFDEDPPLSDSAKTIIDMLKPMRPVSTRIAKLTNKLIPELKGTITGD